MTTDGGMEPGVSSSDKNDPRVYSHTKDGPPKTFLQKQIALNYLWAMIIIWVFGVFKSLKMPKGIFKPKTFAIYFLTSMPVCMLWGHSMHIKDPAYKGWNALEWQTVGKVLCWSIEDLLFYSGCMVLYYYIYRWFHQRYEWKKARFENEIKASFWFSIFLQVVFFGLFGAWCGITLSAIYAVPGLLMMFYVWDRIKVKQLLVYFSAMVLFEVIWDWAMVTWIHLIPNMAWAAGWYYMSFDATGGIHHSKVFMSYPKWWIFENPIEITPYYGIVGALYSYVLIPSIDKFRERYKW